GVMIAILIVAMVARSQIGGQTGDVLGATQICAELFAGIGFIAVMA
ncbi:MAG TPA: adenosylcobinamide-GDP ribazoletransferase, partial [Thalassospira sp.]|nr:adenosylcobinamide-GDP ribazoletransferase [Thalassospira sp.]